jgi:hypothetical protein
MPNYRSILPIIQSNYYTCWAASTAWWTVSMSDRGRKKMTEDDVTDKFYFGWDKNGAMTLKGLVDVFRDSVFNMNIRVGDEKDLDRLLGRLVADPLMRSEIFPVVCGYNDTKAGGNHVCVLTDIYLDMNHNKFIVMDPAIGYTVRSRNYLASQTMIFAWAKEVGDAIYG